MRILPLACVGFLLAMSVISASNAQTVAPGARPVDLDAVARQPAPGTTVPGAFGFTPDGKSLTYLKSEDGSLSRVLWKVDLAGGEPKVIARPPGVGDTDRSVSLEEALRRERQRLRETGITQVIRASKANLAIIPLAGDLYLLRGDEPLVRLTETKSPEIDPKLNADGTKVAFVRDNELYVLDIATKREQKLTTGSVDGLTHGLAEFIAQEEMDRTTGFWWSADGTKIAYQETDERHIPIYSIVHQGGGEPQVETHRYPFSGQANAKVRLGIVSVEGGETLWLKLDPPSADFYLARVDWEGKGSESLLVQLLSRDQKTLRLTRMDCVTGASTTLLDDTAADWVNLHHDLKVVNDESDLLWSTERSGFRHLRLLNKNGVLLQSITFGDWAVDSLVSVDWRRREVYFLSGKDSVVESHLYRVSLDGGVITRLTTEPGLHKVVVSPDGEHWVDTWSSRSTPPKSVIRNRQGEILVTLDDNATDPRVQEYRMTPPELVSFVNRDGVTLHGAYYAPRSLVKEGKAPLVVMLYGGPHVQYVTESWAMTADMTAQLLTERGFAVWKLDNRGSARRGHAFEAAISQHMGEVEVRDQVEGVSFAASRWKTINLARVGVTGASYGGYMTLRCLTEAADVFHAGVSVAPVADWDGYDTCYTERYMATPALNQQGYSSSSVLSRLDRIRGKLLLIHGMLDENVHFRHSARLASGLIRAGIPFEFLPLPTERHSTRLEQDRRYSSDRVIRFLESSLIEH